MPELTYSDVVFKPLDATDDVSSFHSTEQEPDDFLKRGCLRRPSGLLEFHVIEDLQSSLISLLRNSIL